MTLSTDIYLTGPVDAKEVFDFCNEQLLGTTEPRYKHEESSWSAGEWQYMNEPGQGFNAWLWVHYRKDGPLASEDVWEQDEDYRYLATKACTVKVNFDTAYGYNDEFGGCSSLHARYIRALIQYAEEHGATLEWKNEFTDEIFKGTDGLDSFG